MCVFACLCVWNYVPFISAPGLQETSDKTSCLEFRSLASWAIAAGHDKRIADLTAPRTHVNKYAGLCIMCWSEHGCQLLVQLHFLSLAN